MPETCWEIVENKHLTVASCWFSLSLPSFTFSMVHTPYHFHLLTYFAAGACCWPLTPFWCRGHGRVELYLYPPSGPHRACNGITLSFYLLTPWSTVLHDKWTSSQLAKKFPAFYGTQRFIVTFTGTCQLALPWARSMLSFSLQSVIIKNMADVKIKFTL